jgi:predicted permease
MMRKLLLRFRYWFRHRRSSQDLAEEIEFHRFLKQRDLEHSGLSTDDAEAASRRAMGNTLHALESSRRVWIWLWLEQAGQDLQYAVRSLLRAPNFALTAGLTIALGVGANAAVFSLIDAVLLKLLPVENPKELVFVEPAGNPRPSPTPPYPCLARLSSEAGSFSGLAVFATDEMRIEIDGNPEPAMGQVASGNYFAILGVKPALGRLMDTNDESLSPPIAVISDRYWRRRFGGMPSVIGKTISIRNQTFTIAGVTPPEFWGLEPGRPVDVTIPIISRSLTASGAWWFDAIARLKPDVSGSQAQVQSSGAFQSCMLGIRDAGTVREPFQGLELKPAAHGMDVLRRRFSKPLYVLMGLVGLVLLMAITNIANLLLARGIGRRREFAIRLATGAGRARLVRQLLTENLLLFAFGSVTGVLLAGWGVGAIEALFAEGRRPITVEATFNWHVLAFSIMVTLAAGLVSGLLPAWQAFRTDPEQAIKEGQARTSESRDSTTLTRTVVAFQVALSLVLLVGTVTFVRTLTNLYNVDPGFQNKHVLTMSIELPEGYVQAGKSVESWSQVLESVRKIPGVGIAGLSTFTPLSGRDPGATPMRFSGEPADVSDGSVRVNQVSEGYFETLGTQLLRGRLLTDRDAAGSPRVALINESAARKYFGERDPIGRFLEFDKTGIAGTAYQIVGVVNDTKHRNLREPFPAFVFVPTRQPLNAERRVTLVVTSTVPSGYMDLVEPIRRRLASVDPGLLISEVITIQDQLDSTLLTERLLSRLSSAFGVLALTLAAIGLYGVLSYRIGRQRRSIGIQMALGASPSSVAFSVLRQSGLIVTVGLVIGLPFAVLAVRTADSLLWGLNSSDPMIYLVALALLSLVGFVSAYVPARRASAIEPAEALRQD